MQIHLTFERGHRPGFYPFFTCLALDKEPSLIYHEHGIKKTFRRCEMKVRKYLMTGVLVFVCTFILAAGIASGAEKGARYGDTQTRETINVAGNVLSYHPRPEGKN